MGSACCTDQSAIDVRNTSSSSSGTYANHVQHTPLPSPSLSTRKRDGDNKPRHVANPLSRAANPTFAADVSDGATNDMQSPVAVSPATRRPVASDMDVFPLEANEPLVLFVPNGRQKTAAVMWQTSPVSSPSPPPLQQLRKESTLASTASADAATEFPAPPPLPPHALVPPYHHERTHSRSGRGHASSFATFTDGAGSTSGVDSGAALSMQMSGNQVATLMQQAEFAAVSTSTDDTALSSLETHTNGGGVFPSLQAQFAPASNRQRSSFFTATGTNSSTLGNLLSGEPSLDGFMTAQRAQSTASHHHHHPYRHTSVVQMVEVIPQTTNLPLDSNDASWVGRGSMSLHSASGRPTNHNHQSTTSFAGPSAVAVPATENRLRLATFATQRN